MTVEQLNRLLDLQGSDLENWSAPERREALALIERNAAAADLLREYQQLDDLLSLESTEDFTQIKIAVRNQSLPPQQISVFDRLVGWLIPEPGAFARQFWRPSLAASLPLVFGLLLGNVFSFGVEPISAQEIEYWDDELALLSLNDYSGEEL